MLVFIFAANAFSTPLGGTVLAFFAEFVSARAICRRCEIAKFNLKNYFWYDCASVQHGCFQDFGFQLVLRISAKPCTVLGDAAILIVVASFRTASTKLGLTIGGQVKVAVSKEYTTIKRTIHPEIVPSHSVLEWAFKHASVDITVFVVDAI